MLAGLGNLAGMMKQAKSLQQNMLRAQEELERQTVEGGAGAGMVAATVNGHGKMVGIRISPEAVNPNDVEMLEDLVKAAVIDAQEKAREAEKQALTEATGGIDFGALRSLLGGK